jgi:hypothetical protein
MTGMIHRLRSLTARLRATTRKPWPAPFHLPHQFKGRRFFAFPFLVFLLFVNAQRASAQLGGENLRGDFGLKSGSQAPPGYYLGDMFYFYDSSEVRLAGGTKIPGPSLHLFGNFFLLNWVSEKKFLGAHWGVTVAPTILNAALTLPRLDFDTSHWGMGDSYIQPIQLGWHFKQADAFAGYAFFAPTGRFTAGASDNTGLGMWSNEFSLGTTVYFDPERKWHASAAGFYEIHSSKHDQDLTVGDIVTLEGGIGRAFLKGYANAGLAYFGQWKVSPDSGSDVSPLVAGQKGYMLGLGPELNMPIPLGKTPLILTFRYLFDTRSRFSTQGDSALLSLVFAKTAETAGH